MGLAPGTPMHPAPGRGPRCGGLCAGLVAQSVDITGGVLSSYGYDNAGNRTYEAYSQFTRAAGSGLAFCRQLCSARAPVRVRLGQKARPDPVREMKGPFVVHAPFPKNCPVCGFDTGHIFQAT